jgi:hypothetical protein
LRDAILLHLEIFRLQVGDEVAVLAEYADVHLDSLRARLKCRRLLGWRRLLLARCSSKQQRSDDEREQTS